MGWEDGQGLGRYGAGLVTPVAVSTVVLHEGVGLGCEAVPEAKVFKSNVEQRIYDFICAAAETELAFDPDLSKADRGARPRSSHSLGSETFRSFTPLEATPIVHTPSKPCPLF